MDGITDGNPMNHELGAGQVVVAAGVLISGMFFFFLPVFFLLQAELQGKFSGPVESAFSLGHIKYVTFPINII